MLPAFIIPLIGVLVVVFIAFYGFTTHGYLVHFTLLAAPIGVYLVNNPTLLLILIFGLYQSGVIMPGLPQGLQFVHMLMFVFVVISLARNIIAKPQRKSLGSVDLWLYGILLLLAVIIYYRGLGLYSGGGDLVGGASYIKLYIGAGFLLLARYYSLTPKQLRKTIVFILLGSFLPALAQIVFLASGGRIHQHFMFIQPYVYGLLESLAGLQGGQGEFRLHAFASISINLLSLVLVFIPFLGTNRIKVLFWTGLCVLMAMLSGFRSNVIEIMAITILFLIFSAPRGLRVSYASAVAILFGAGLIAAIPLMPHLPYAAQRALSWLPFADVSFYAKADADASALWRLEVWNYSLSHWREFAWIGRGFTMRLSDLMVLSQNRDLAMEAYYGHNYHSGPVSLLIDMGVPGFILGTGFLLATALYAMKALPFDTEPFIARAYDLFRVKCLYGVFSFYFIHGDARTTLITIFMNLALLEAIRTTSKLYSKNAPAPPATAPVWRTQRPAAAAQRGAT